jgi:hypothetical protein
VHKGLRETGASLLAICLELYINCLPERFKFPVILDMIVKFSAHLSWNMTSN